LKWVEKKLGDEEFITLVPISDTHDGDRQFDRAKLIKLVQDIEKTPNMYGFLLGDLCNNATKNSKSDVYSATMTPQEQKWDIIDILSTIQGKLLGSTGGNHEERSHKESGLDVSEDIAKALMIPYDPFGILYSIKFGQCKSGKQNYTMYTTHGSGGGGTKGAKINKLHSLRNICIADVYVMGHVHDIITTNDMCFVPDTRHSRMVKHIRYYTTSGSYLDWGGYTERLMLNPVVTGFPLINLNGLKKEVRITI
jgi:predicted phosphodiesterase